LPASFQIILLNVVFPDHQFPEIKINLLFLERQNLTIFFAILEEVSFFILFVSYVIKALVSNFIMA
jgi:hypothetical protein